MIDESATGRGFDGRIEDDPLLRGTGRFGDDIALGHQLHAVFVRSPHAAADIGSIDIAEATTRPGVVAVLTGADMDAAGLGNVSRPRNFPGAGPEALAVVQRPVLATTRVHHIGQAVAMVIADSPAAARDGAERVEVDYREIPAVADVVDAEAPGAPQLWPEAPGNVALDWPGPVAEGPEAAAALDRAFANAAHVARVRLVNQRLVVAPLEPRAATADYDPAGDRLTFCCGSQGVAGLRAQLAAILDLAPDRLRVISDDVGGAFGMRTPAYPEYAALLMAARRLGRPIHWCSTRSDAFVSDNQGRDSVTEAELAIDAGGRFTALKVHARANMGAFLTAEGAFIATANFGRCFPTVYAIPHIRVTVRCLYSHSLPTGPYRGAGRPEANYVMERLVEAAARVSGHDPIALRRANMIGPEMMPHLTAVGTTYDSGAFEEILDIALKRADHAGLNGRRAAARAAGRRRGFGISCFLEHAGGPPSEPAAIRFPDDGGIVVALGAQSGGQGHATVFARLAAQCLQVPVGDVAVRAGDTDLGQRGFGSVASRSAMLAGNAIAGACETVLAKGRRVAARLLEAAEADIDYSGGVFAIRGTDRQIPLIETAARARELRDPEIALLDSQHIAKLPQSFPNGCHIAEVDIDPETGAVALVRYTAIDDCGRVLNATLAEGQVHGGIAQGVGQALVERAVYGRRDGQLLSGSFMDYAMPRAELLPMIDAGFHPVACRTNPLGVKGVGEAGTTAAPAAVMNAIIDALPRTLTRALTQAPDLDMPATPEKIWRACQGG